MYIYEKSHIIAHSLPQAIYVWEIPAEQPCGNTMQKLTQFILGGIKLTSMLGEEALISSIKLWRLPYCERYVMCASSLWGPESKIRLNGWGFRFTQKCWK